MKVTTFIADDEPVARAALRAMLRSMDWLEVVGEAADGLTAAREIDRLRPELALLDIEMPGLSGTAVVRALTHLPYVVFTTAYDDHAIAAFELGAVDYILKPFREERLAQSLHRVRAAIGEPLAHPTLERMAAIFEAGSISRLFVRRGDQLVPLAVSSISRFEADGDYVVAHTDRGSHLAHVALARLEQRLDPTQFVRVHRAHIVNLDAVRIFRRESGTMTVEMNDGTRVPVSRPHAHTLRAFAR
jgi:two-component system, LytTR family, response regulator